MARERTAVVLGNHIHYQRLQPAWRAGKRSHDNKSKMGQQRLKLVIMYWKRHKVVKLLYIMVYNTNMIIIGQLANLPSPTVVIIQSFGVY